VVNKDEYNCNIYTVAAEGAKAAFAPGGICILAGTARERILSPRFQHSRGTAYWLQEFWKLAFKSWDVHIEVSMNCDYFEYLSIL